MAKNYNEEYWSIEDLKARIDKLENDLKRRKKAVEFSNSCEETAEQLRTMYAALRNVGFTDEQSFQIIFKSLPNSK